MAARVLSGVGRGPAALAWTYALTLGFGLVYLGEHYVIDLIAGFALAEAIWRAAPLAEPASPAVPGDRAPGGARGLSGALAAGAARAELELVEDARGRGRRGARPGRRHAGASGRQPQAAPGVLLFLLLIVAIYVLAPEGASASTTRWQRMDEAKWYWIVGRGGLQRRRVRRLRGAVPRRARRIARRRGAPPARTCAPRTRSRWPGLAATRIFSAAGAGGIARHLLGAAQGRHAAPALGLPDGRVPGADVLAVPAGAGGLRRAAAHRGAARAATRSAARSCPPRSRAGCWRSCSLIALIPQDVERRLHELRAAATGARASSRASPRRPATLADRRAHRDRLRAPPQARARSRSSARSASGRPTSACCGRASRRSAATCRSACSCRASSWAWPRT